ncbi:DUF4349 domain-containing protein [Aquibacillus rhizosphaerae]|uniref:DUF4349 domain-containing protein n=1 Tax=Aquibacillus rhizosphaerae TaxID=3051431 RepID=A0ABT7L939_9BACI|nr:DUF4349 domain-containing protein [Aquibacillus sp. LR5S19]MDL4841090.1 DUF4349 domain-containing protein [Aquibacillus sp. LR5S19]
MKKLMIGTFIIAISIILVACSGGESAQESSDTATTEDSGATMNGEESKDEMSMANENFAEGENAEEDDNAEENSTPDIPEQTERKVIYNATLNIEVKDYTTTVNTIEAKVQENGGYIVESNTYGGSEDEFSAGMMRVRIPQQQFQSFIDVIEEGSVKVLERNVSGEDVTEQYVDLESRLKSKRVVEERLLSFMEQAEKTEDLLTISGDLAKVQEEIEQITGKMNYLENQSSLATVTIQIHENRVNIPNVNDEDLNTWEKTKQQFMESINFLLTAISGLIVFFVGNLPVLLLFALIGLFVFRIIWKRRKQEIAKKENS